MLEFLKQKMDVRAESDDVSQSEQDLIVAACALLLEMAHVDNEFTDEESSIVFKILKDEYGVSESDAKAIADAAEEERKQSLDLYQFTSMLNEHFSKEERLRVVEMLWTIVYADGKLSGHEDFLVHRMAKMLNLSHSDLIDAKLNVLYEDEDE